MTLHGDALTSDEAAQLAAIRDRHEADRARNMAMFSTNWNEIRLLLGWHDRLASLLAEREAEIDRLRAELLKTPPTLEWLKSSLGRPNVFDGLYQKWVNQGRESAVRYSERQREIEVLSSSQSGRVWVLALTRADVLAAVKGME